MVNKTKITLSIDSELLTNFKAGRQITKISNITEFVEQAMLEDLNKHGE